MPVNVAIQREDTLRIKIKKSNELICQQLMPVNFATEREDTIKKSNELICQQLIPVNFAIMKMREDRTEILKPPPRTMSTVLAAQVISTVIILNKASIVSLQLLN